MLTLCSQPCYFDTFRVDVAAADYAVHVTALFFYYYRQPFRSLYSLQASRLPPTPLDDLSVSRAWGFDRRISRYVYVVPFTADLFPSSGTLGRFSFEPYK